MSSNDRDFIEENTGRDELGFVMDEIESHQFQSLQPTAAHPSFANLAVVPQIGDPLEGRNENDCSLVIPPPVELRHEFSFQQAQPVNAEDVLRDDRNVNVVPVVYDSHFASTIEGMTPTVTPTPGTPIQQVPVTPAVQQSPPEVVTTMIDTTGRGGSKSTRPSSHSFGFPPASTGRAKRSCRKDAAAIVDRNDAASATHVEGSIAQKRNEKLREKGAAKAAQKTRPGLHATTSMRVQKPREAKERSSTIQDASELEQDAIVGGNKTRS